MFEIGDDCSRRCTLCPKHERSLKVKSPPRSIRRWCPNGVAVGIVRRKGRSAAQASKLARFSVFDKRHAAEHKIIASCCDESLGRGRWLAVDRSFAGYSRRARFGVAACGKILLRQTENPSCRFQCDHPCGHRLDVAEFPE
jgi:hypothetical protein